MEVDEEKSNVIYGYYSKVHNRIMYVGQTKHLKDRNQSHLFYEPYRLTQNHSNYPLSLGIKKYGVDNYVLKVLEKNIKAEDLNEREKYWIAYYNTYINGYNQTAGGQETPFSIYSDDMIQKIIHLLKDTEMSMTDIKELTGVSLTHIWNINTGNRRKQDDLCYPLRNSSFKGTKGLLLSPEEVEEIIDVIQNTNLNITEISNMFNVSSYIVKGINNGTTEAYRKPGYTYPIRNFNNYLTNEVARNIISYIKDNPSMALTEIAKHFNVAPSKVNCINSGKSHKQPDETYPIRKYTRISMEEDVIKQIQQDLIDNTLDYNAISQKYNIDNSIVSRINTGRLFKNKSLNYPLRINNKIDNIRKHL